MVLFKCNGCGLTKEVSDKFANKSVSCPKCKKSVSIAGPSEPGNGNHRYSISDFVNRTAQKDRGQGFVVIQPCEEAYFQSA
jgi:hypothetical protein